MSASAAETTAPKPAWSMPARCARNSARLPRRSSSPRAMSTTLRAGRSALQGRGAGLPVFALRQPDGRDVRGAHGGVRRRRSRARDRDRHGGRHARSRPAQGRRPRRRAPRRCSAPAATSSRIILPRFGVASTLVDGTDLDAWRNAVRPNTKTFFLESPTNPTLDVIDIAAVAKIAHAAGATLVVDNVFATPLFQSPLALGADCVVYSATKHIDGQGRCLGGVDPGVGEIHPGQCAHPDPADRPVDVAVQCLGAAQGPGDAGGARAPPDRHARRRSRSRSSEHPKITRLIYPGRPDHPQAAIAQKQMRGGSTLVAFEIKGGKAGGLPLPGRAQARAHQQQSRRRQEPHHPSGDDDASAADAGGARRTRHQRRAGAGLGRPRTSGRYRGRRAHRPGGGIDHVVTVRL